MKAPLALVFCCHGCIRTGRSTELGGLRWKSRLCRAVHLSSVTGPRVFLRLPTHLTFNYAIPTRPLRVVLLYVSPLYDCT